MAGLTTEFCETQKKTNQYIYCISQGYCSPRHRSKVFLHSLRSKHPHRSPCASDIKSPRWSFFCVCVCFGRCLESPAAVWTYTPWTLSVGISFSCVHILNLFLPRAFAFCHWPGRGFFVLMKKNKRQEVYAAKQKSSLLVGSTDSLSRGCPCLEITGSKKNQTLPEFKNPFPLTSFALLF